MQTDGFVEEGPGVSERWHVIKGVPIAVLLVLIVQTGGGIWFLAQLTSKVDYAVATLQQFQSERYTRDDARHDRELLMQMVDSLRQRDTDHDRRLAILEEFQTGRRLKAQ